MVDGNRGKYLLYVHTHLVQKLAGLIHTGFKLTEIWEEWRQGMKWCFCFALLLNKCNLHHLIFGVLDTYNYENGYMDLVWLVGAIEVEFSKNGLVFWSG